MNKKISIITPCYNESNVVNLFYSEINKLFIDYQNLDLEMIFIDDGSSDDTLAKLMAINLKDNRVKVLEFARNFGKEAALTAGIDYATGDAVIPIDVDLQDPPDLMIKMIEKWSDGADIVLAKRLNRKTDSILKRITAELFYKWHNKISDIQIPVNVGDYRLIDRKVVDVLKKLPERHRFMKGLFAWVGFKTVEINYARNARAAGVTKFSGWRLWNFAIEGITGFSTAPLKLWTYIGALGALMTMFYAAWIALRTIIYGIDVPGYASLMVAVLFIGSIQLLSIGILGEYIGRIYMEVKGRPLYLIRNIHGKIQ